jgi:CheY-like chemotaxis protein
MDNQTARLLVVDDDINLRELLMDTLNSIGYSADAAADGYEALQKLTDRSYDLMITDIKMPGIDGVALLKKVRRRYPRLPVLFITGYPSPEIIGRASPDGFLAKPFRIQHVEQLIRDALAGRSEHTSRPIRRVLIVDDDAMFREMLADTLQHNSIIPTAVEGGQEALRELEHGEVDAIIADIRMPGMDGLTLTARIKKEHPEIPVILITAFFADEQLDARTREVAADGFLQKPFEAQKIIDLLNRIQPPGADRPG